MFFGKDLKNWTKISLLKQCWVTNCRSSRRFTFLSINGKKVGLIWVTLLKYHTCSIDIWFLVAFLSSTADKKLQRTQKVKRLCGLILDKQGYQQPGCCLTGNYKLFRQSSNSPHSAPNVPTEHIMMSLFQKWKVSTAPNSPHPSLWFQVYSSFNI